MNVGALECWSKKEHLMASSAEEFAEISMISLPPPDDRQIDASKNT
jgi:hypothetical protein